jgi:excisionase family DNA binding protein
MPTAVAFKSRTITPEDVADDLRCHKAKVWELIRSGELPAAKFGRRYLIDVDAYKTFKAQHGLASTAAGDDDAPVDPNWVAAQVAKFSPDDLRRAGELLLALSRTEVSGGAK